jgi:hypothetical protein
MENIIIDMKGLIYDLKRMEGNVKTDREDTIRALSNGMALPSGPTWDNEEDIWEKTAKTYENGLLDAQDALQKAAENLRLIQGCMEYLIDAIEYAELSNKVHGKAIRAAQPQGK